MPGDRPLETGWLADTPVGDTVLRRFLFNQADANAKIATASGGRHERTDAVAMADANGPVPYFNQAILLQPLASADDPTLDHLAAFYRAASGTHTLLSLWPTPDLASRGWSLVGHPAFMVRGAFPSSFKQSEGVTVRTAATSEDLHEAERIAVEGYPLDEARDLPPGRLGKRSCGHASAMVPRCRPSRIRATTADPDSSAWALCPRSVSRCGPPPTDHTSPTRSPIYETRCKRL